MTAPRVRAALFDLDGTLVDSVASVAEAMVAALALHGIEETRERLVPRIGSPVNVYFQEAYGLSPAEAEAVTTDYQRFYHDCYIAQTQAHAGADALLRLLHRKGLALGVVTNKDSRGAHAIIERQRWGDLFEVVSTRETAPAKPHPEAVLSALRAIDVAAAEAALIGDTEFDMHCGRDAGVAFVVGLVGARSREQLEAEGATHIVERLADVAPLLGVRRDRAPS